MSEFKKRLANALSFARLIFHWSYIPFVIYLGTKLKKKSLKNNFLKLIIFYTFSRIQSRSWRRTTRIAIIAVSILITFTYIYVYQNKMMLQYCEYLRLSALIFKFIFGWRFMVPANFMTKLVTELSENIHIYKEKVPFYKSLPYVPMRSPLPKTWLTFFKKDRFITF